MCSKINYRVRVYACMYHDVAVGERDDEMDVIIVPGLAFDHGCRRLGRGKGYYDRYLSAHARGARLIGIALRAQLSDDPLPCDQYDVPLHAIVHADGVISSKTK